jgi:16S rRNA (cytosine967-C5)-methyltransferase
LVDAAPILAARTPLHIEGPYLSLRPDVHGTDGFFAAIFERKKNLVLETVTTASKEEVEIFEEAVKTPAKKRVRAQKVEPPLPDLDSDRKDA